MDCLISKRWMDEDSASKAGNYAGSFFLECTSAVIFHKKIVHRELTLIDAERKKTNKPIYQSLSKLQMDVMAIIQKEAAEAKAEAAKNKKRLRKQIGNSIWTDSEKIAMNNHLNEYARKGIDSSWRRAALA